MQENPPSKELQAMIDVEQSLQDLGPEVQGRIINWAAERFGVWMKGSRKTPTGRSDDLAIDFDRSDYETVAEFHDAAGPSTDATRALVVGYWIQVAMGESTFKSASVNKELKDLGHAVGNITGAFDVLKDKTPALVVQVAKRGKTKQARKEYKVTDAGKKEVERMLHGPANEQ